MRPTVDEQLREVRRVLQEVVAPEVHGDYPADTLRAALATLEMLERAWSQVLPFLQWDNDATAALLRAALERDLPHDLGDRIRAAVAREPLDPTDVDRAHGRNLELRALLAELVPVAFRWDAEETDARVVAHLRERARRYPFATV